MLGSQMNDSVADFLDPAIASHWIRVLFLLQDRVVLQLCQARLPVQIRVQEGTGDAVHSDAEASQFDRS